MRVAMTAPYYLPGPRLFQLIGMCDYFVFLDEALSEPKHRKASLKTPAGRITLTVPIKERKGQKLKDVEIQGPLWQRRHWNCIELAYKGCKYHKIVEEFLDFYLLKKWNNLSLLNLKLIKKISRVLGYDTVKFFRQSQFSNKKSDAILTELDGILVENNFVEKPYRQLHGGFIPNLSALDYIFNCGGRGKYDLRSWFI